MKINIKKLGQKAQLYRPKTHRAIQLQKNLLRTQSNNIKKVHEISLIKKLRTLKIV